MARNYAALSHEYLEEMAELDDAEFGRLTRALLKYSMTGEVVELPGNERFYYRRVLNHEDRHQANYAELAEKRSEAGRKAANSRWAARDALRIDAMRGDAKNANTNTNTETKTNHKTKINPLLAAAGKRTAPTAADRMRKELEALEQVLERERDGA